MVSNAQQEQFMRRALALADEAEALDEVPVGALVVLDGAVIGEGCNAVISRNDPSAHAEIVALRDAAARVGNYRLPGAELYVTLEPCTMCCGTLVHARIARLVFGAREPRAGVVCSCDELLDRDFVNHRVAWSEGVLAQECGDKLRRFFQRRRKPGN